MAPLYLDEVPEAFDSHVFVDKLYAQVSLNLVVPV